MSSPSTSPALEVVVRDGQLFVGGQRYLIVGGELHNSGASTPEAIARALDSAVEIGVRVVLAPIAWEDIEPSEGSFDFSLVDELITGCRQRGLLLIPLWFGTWKNGMSTYAPGWVKTNHTRFPRITLADGSPIEAVTPFSTDCRKADARAFSRLLSHLSTTGADVTLMVQVENEVGTLGAPRDYSPQAAPRWTAPVPTAITDALEGARGRLADAWRAAGQYRKASWSETFGDEASEAFMAWAYADYIETVAAAGRAHLNVPLFVNAWLDVAPDRPEGLALTGGVRAGDYPSGGPLRHTAIIWRTIAPTLDFLAPDIYVGPFDDICTEYRAASGALFLPEMRCDAVGVGHMFRAIGEHGAIGASPFAFDTVTNDDPDRELLQDAYRLLAAAGALLRNYPTARTRGFTLTEQHPRLTFDFDETTVTVEGDHRAELFPLRYPGYGLVIQTDDASFVLGRGFGITWRGSNGAQRGFLRVDELESAGEGFTTLRRLNGDEAGTWLRFPALRQRQTDALPIRQNLRLTGILRVTTYAV